MKENISPEERLLRLIKGEKEEPKLTSQNILDRPAPISFKRYLNIEYLEKSLGIIFFISLIYLIITFSLALVPKKIDSASLPKKEEKEKEEPEPEIKPFNFYLEGISRQPVFVSEVTDITKSTETSLKGTESVKDFNLLGIISGENPQAIIENKKTQKTYFLKRGEFIGEFQLEEVGEGKVTLNYQGQRFDLFL